MQITLKQATPTNSVPKQERSLEAPIKSDWKNCDNASFYEKISIETNVMNSILGGLEAGEELALVHSYIESAKSILEVGAGYGRALNYLTSHNSKAKIYAVERSPKLCGILRERFKDRVQIYQCDLLNFHPNDTYDLILWLFCGISDFAADEQLPVLKKLSSHLMDNGVFILETFSHTMKPDNAQSYAGQNYVIELEGQMLQGFIPSPEMIKEYAAQLGFKKTEHIPYQTSCGSKRALHILSQ